MPAQDCLRCAESFQQVCNSPRNQMHAHQQSCIYANLHIAAVVWTTGSRFTIVSLFCCSYLLHYQSIFLHRAKLGSCCSQIGTCCLQEVSFSAQFSCSQFRAQSQFSSQGQGWCCKFASYLVHGSEMACQVISEASNYP